MITISPTFINFGNVRRGTRASRQITVTTSSTGSNLWQMIPTTVQASALPAPFSSNAVGYHNMMRSAQFYVDCIPDSSTPLASAGTWFTITDLSDPTHSAQVGLAALVIDNELQVSPAKDTIDFGKIEFGSVVETIISISNGPNANAALTLSSITLSTSGQFAPGASIPASVTLNPGDVLYYPVQFSPTSAYTSEQTATLTIAHNADNIASPLVITIKGIGADVWDFRTPTYTLLDQSQMRAHIYIKYTGTIPDFVSGNANPDDGSQDLGAYGVSIKTIDKYDIRTDLNGLVSYPAAIRFTLNDLGMAGNSVPQSWLSNILIGDDNAYNFVGVKLERSTDGGTTWSNEFEGGMQIDAREADLGVQKLSFTFDSTIYTYALSNVTMDQLFNFKTSYTTPTLMQLPAYPGGYDPIGADVPGVGKLLHIGQIGLPTVNSLSTATPSNAFIPVGEFLGYIFYLMNYLNNNSDDWDPIGSSVAPTFNVHYQFANTASGTQTPATSATSGSFDLSQMYFLTSNLQAYCQAPNYMSIYGTPFNTNGLAGTLCPIRDFLRAFCLTTGTRIEIRGINDVRIQQLFDPSASLATAIDPTLEIHPVEGMKVQPLGCVEYFAGNGNGAGSHILGLPQVSPQTVWTKNSFTYKVISASQNAFSTGSNAGNYPSYSEAQRTDNTLQIVQVSLYSPWDKWNVDQGNELISDLGDYPRAPYTGSPDFYSNISSNLSGGSLSTFALHPYQITNFWYQILSTRMGIRYRSIELPGLGYDFAGLLTANGYTYFPLELTKDYMTATTRLVCAVIPTPSSWNFPNPFASAIQAADVPELPGLQVTQDENGNSTIATQKVVSDSIADGLAMSESVSTVNGAQTVSVVAGAKVRSFTQI